MHDNIYFFIFLVTFSSTSENKKSADPPHDKKPKTVPQKHSILGSQTFKGCNDKKILKIS